MRDEKMSTEPAYRGTAEHHSPFRKAFIPQPASHSSASPQVDLLTMMVDLDAKTMTLKQNQRRTRGAAP